MSTLLHCAVPRACAQDCQCRQLAYPQADLVVKVSDLLAELSVASFNFSARSCSLVEACVAATGTRRLLKFSVSVLNQGTADVTLPDPTLHPLSFHFSPCHQHFHYTRFAEYSLSRDGQEQVVGHKESFCLMDTQQQLVGRHIQCLPHYNCTHPGIQRGWSDYYGADLDCQWIDVTGLPAGEYSLRVEVNQARLIAESSYDNNGPPTQRLLCSPHSHCTLLSSLPCVALCSGGGEGAAALEQSSERRCEGARR